MRAARPLLATVALLALLAPAARADPVNLRVGQPPLSDGAAAAKWGLSANLVRAVAATENWWRMSTVGDNGDSFGRFQVRRPYHCRGTLVCGLFRHDAAINADYWASIDRQAHLAEHGLGQRSALRRRRPVGLDRRVVLGALARPRRRGLRHQCLLSNRPVESPGGPLTAHRQATPWASHGRPAVASPCGA